MTPIFDALCLEHRSAGMSYPGSPEGYGKPEPRNEVRSVVRRSGARSRDQSTASEGEPEGPGRHTFLIA